MKDSKLERSVLERYRTEVLFTSPNKGVNFFFCSISLKISYVPSRLGLKDFLQPVNKFIFF